MTVSGMGQTSLPTDAGRIHLLVLSLRRDVWESTMVGRGKREIPKEETPMQLTEQHVIARNDPRYAVIDAAAFASKNLYNAALYEIRQAFIHEGTYLSYHEMDKLMQPHEAYKALPAKVSQQVLLLLAKNYLRSLKHAQPTRKTRQGSPDAHGSQSTSTKLRVATSWCTPPRPSVREG